MQHAGVEQDLPARPVQPYLGSFIALSVLLAGILGLVWPLTQATLVKTILVVVAVNLACHLVPYSLVLRYFNINLSIGLVSPFSLHGLRLRLGGNSLYAERARLKLGWHHGYPWVGLRLVGLRYSQGEAPSSPAKEKPKQEPKAKSHEKSLWVRAGDLTPRDVRRFLRRVRKQLVWQPIYRLSLLGRTLAPAIALLGVELADCHFDDASLDYAHARLHVVRSYTGLFSIKVHFDGVRAKGVTVRHSVLDIRAPFDSTMGLPTLLTPRSVELALTLGKVIVEDRPTGKKVKFQEPPTDDDELPVEQKQLPDDLKREPNKILTALRHVCVTVHSVRATHDGVTVSVASSRARLLLGPVLAAGHPHREVYGKDRGIAMGIKVGIGEVGVSFAGASHGLSMAHSSLELTSTWLPPALQRHLPIVADPNSLNDHIIVAQASLGALCGELRTDELQSFFETRKEHAKAHARQVKKPAAAVKDAPTALGLPRVLLSLRVDEGHVGAHLHEKASRLGLRIPSVLLAVESNYVELAYHRSRKERLKAEKGENYEPVHVADDITRPPFSYDPSRGHTLLYAVSTHLEIGAIAVEAGKHRILELSAVEADGSSKVYGHLLTDDGKAGVPLLDLASKESRVNLVAEKLDIALWRPDVLSSLRSLLSLVPKSSPAPAPAPSSPMIDRLPLNMRIYASLNGFRARLAGPGSPAHEKRHLRGVDLRFSRLTLEYILRTAGRRAHVDWSYRKGLGLEADDIADHANALAVDSPKEKVALLSISTRKLELAPMVDAEKAAAESTEERKRRRARAKSELQPLLEDAPAPGQQLEWELLSRARPENEKRNGPEPHQSLQADIFDIPVALFNVEIRGPKGDDSKVLNRLGLKVEVGHVLAKFSMLHIYCVLAAIRAALVLSPSHHDGEAVQKKPTPAKKPSTTTLSLNASANKVELFITLPHNVRLLLSLRRMDVWQTPSDGGKLKIDSVLLAGVSVQWPGQWEDLARIFSPITSWPGRETVEEHQRIRVHAKTARLRVPYKYVLSEAIDNIVTMVKATKQLAHECMTGSTRIIIEPVAEDPKHLPRIAITFDLFVAEAEDDPLETNLNSIWRAGTSAQLDRIQLYAALERKIAILEGREQPDAPTEESESDGSVAHPSHQAHRKLTAEHAEGVDAEVGRRRAHEYFASEWIRRIRNAKSEQERRERAQLEAINSRLTHEGVDDDCPVPLLALTYATPLVRAVFKGFDWNVSPPTCGYGDGLLDYMHETGKVPRDLKYSLFVPLHLEWSFAEVKIKLRDYPLPIMHIPMPSGGVDDRAWRLAADFVIAEELRDHNSTRRVPCQVIPREEGEPAGVAFLVPRSAMPTKFYGLPVVEITSAHPVKISWGNAMSPAMSDVARVFDTLSKVPPDPSERIGFWDKTRLKFHGNVRFFFDGALSPVFLLELVEIERTDNLPLTLFHKGTRDPYELTGYGAGFVMRWDGHVRILLGCSNPEKEFLQFESDRYRLCVPNLVALQDWAAAGFERRGSSSSVSDEQLRDVLDPRDDKVVLELANGVRWGMRIDCERTCREDECDKGCAGPTFDRRCRQFDFKPHWEVQTRTAETMHEVKDSYTGFRSDFVHFSISIVAPAKRNQSIPSTPSSYSSSDVSETNQLHLSPLMSNHFWAWWSTFESALSLPIRQGRLFPSAQEGSKKFGKHTATIKYRLAVAPLYIAHTYRKHSVSDWKKGQTSVIGLKARADHFNVDMHQRAQTETHVHLREGDKRVEKTITHKVFYQAELDCDNVDMRVISATFDEPDKARVYSPADGAEEGEEDDLAFEDSEAPPLTEEDRKWVNVNDYTDLGFQHTDPDPVHRILQVMTCPHVTYYRQPAADDDSKIGKTQEGSSSERPQPIATSKFGDEDTHVCLIGRAASMLEIRQRLIHERHDKLHKLQKHASLVGRVKKAYGLTQDQIDAHEQSISNLETQLGVIQDAVDDGEDDVFDAMRHPGKVRMSPGAGQGPRPDPPYGAAEPLREAVDASAHSDIANSSVSHIFRAAMTDWERYGNRLLVHNPTVRITNTSRDILLGYVYSRRERKAESYQMTSKAIKQVRDLARKKEEQSHSKRSSSSSSSSSEESSSASRPSSSPVVDAEQIVKGLAKQLAAGLTGKHDERKPRDHDDGESKSEDGADLDGEPEFDLDVAKAGKHLHSNERLQNSFVALFIAPQVALQSLIDEKSEILVGAWHASLKVFSVVDENCANDPVNQLVRHSSFGILKGLQVYCPKPRHKDLEPLLPSRGFIPMEMLLDEKLSTVSFDRLMPAVDSRLRYDKYNQLRIAHSYDKHGNEITDSAMHDRFGAECLRFLIAANPTHYAAIYNIVTDLILYTDPAQKMRSTTVESVLLVDDFSNLSHMADVVRDYQAGVRQQEERLAALDEHRSLSAHDYFDPCERYAILADKLRATRNLRLLMEAITMSQSRQGGTGAQAAGPGLQMSAHAEEIEWDMQTADARSIAQLVLSDIDFAWRSKKDGSVSNELRLGDFTALNAHTGAAFPEIIAKLEQTPGGSPIAEMPFCSLLWNVSPPVGGINVVEKLELNLHPIRLAIEHSVGRKILDYVFSSQRNKSGEMGKNTTAPTRKESDDSTTSNGRSVSPNRLSRAASREFTESPMSSRLDLPSSATSSPSSASSFDSRSRRSSRMSKPSVADLAARYKYNADGLDVEEMRKRQALYRAFIYAVIDNTTLSLSYKSNGKSKLPDLYGLSLKTPSFVYRNQTLSYLDLLNHVKKDVTNTAWKQSASLLKQVIFHAGRPASAYNELGKRAQIAQRRLRTRLQSLDWAMDVRSPTSPQAGESTTASLSRSRQRSAASTGTTSGSKDSSGEDERLDRSRSPLARAGNFLRLKGVSPHPQPDSPRETSPVLLGGYDSPPRSPPSATRSIARTFSQRSSPTTPHDLSSSQTASANRLLHDAIAEHRNGALPSPLPHHEHPPSEEDKGRLLLGKAYDH